MFSAVVCMVFVFLLFPLRLGAYQKIPRAGVGGGMVMQQQAKKSVRFAGASDIPMAPPPMVETKLVDGRQVVLQDPHLRMFEHQKYVEIA